MLSLGTLIGEHDNSQAPEKVYERTNLTMSDPYYQQLLDKKIPVIGIWDDHDYGVNDGSKTFVRKDLVRDIFLDFLGEPQDSDRRLEKDTGIYQDYIVTMPRRSSSQPIKIHIILLDNRFDFDKTTGDRLGDAQSEWLDKSIEEHKDADVTIIAAGVQILPQRFLFDEKFRWESKYKLLQVLNKHRMSGVVFLSGDVHFANAYHMNCKSLTGYDIHEVTSSGMTHNNNQIFGYADILIDGFTNKFWQVRAICLILIIGQWSFC